MTGVEFMEVCRTFCGFHAGLVTATGPYTDPTAHSGWLPTVCVYVCRLCMLKKHNLEFHTNTFQLDCGEDISWGAGLSLCVCEHHHPASTMLKWLYDCMKNKCRQGWDDMSCQCTSRPLPSAPPGSCKRASSQQWPHCLGTLEFTHSSVHSNVTCISTLHPQRRNSLPAFTVRREHLEKIHSLYPDE